MADIVETVIGMAEPALKAVGGVVEDLQRSFQKMINVAVAEALKAAGATGAGPASSAAVATGSSAARVRPLRAPGR